MELGQRLLALVTVVFSQDGVRRPMIALGVQRAFEPTERPVRPAATQGNDAYLVAQGSILRVAGDAPDDLVQTAEVIQQLPQATLERGRFSLLALRTEALHELMQNLA